MNVDVRVDRELNHAAVVLSGPFDIAHSTEVVRAVQRAEAHLDGCHSAEVSLARVNRIDGTGAVLVALLLEHLARSGCRTEVNTRDNPKGARLLSLYHRLKTDQPSLPPRTMHPFARLGATAAEIPAKANDAFDFTGHCAAALPKAVAVPSSVDWRSIPRLMQEIGADAWPDFLHQPWNR